MTDSGWRSDTVLAWTRHDGPRQPPAGPPRALLVPLAGAMAVVYVGLLFTDTLCPEHRAWVHAIAGASIVVAGTAVVALLRGWAGAGLLAVAATVGGVSIGLMDAVHSPTRGRIVALCFAVLFVLSAAALLMGGRLRRWEHRELPAAAADLPPLAPAGLPPLDPSLEEERAARAPLARVSPPVA